MRRRRALRCIAISLALTPFLVSCGFQLQGEAELPPEMTATIISTGNPYSQFVRRLTIMLEQNGASVVEGGGATAVLEIPLDEVRKDVLSIGGTARIREYRVVHRVRFRLLDADGAVLVPTQSLEQSRVISFDEQDILAATREEEFLRDELADTLAREVLRRLGTGGA
jgi:LPS-assembly lipoprotein